MMHMYAVDVAQRPRENVQLWMIAVEAVSQLGYTR